MNNEFLASFNIAPHSGLGGCIPRPKKDKVENKLSNAVQQLSESQKDFHKQMNRSVGKFKKLGNSVYDNSAGFLTEDEL